MPPPHKLIKDMYEVQDERAFAKRQYRKALFPDRRGKLNAKDTKRVADLRKTCLAMDVVTRAAALAGPEHNEAHAVVIGKLEAATCKLRACKAFARELIAIIDELKAQVEQGREGR